MSKIEWTEKTWNPIAGCSRVSEGCRHCYAERMAGRLEAMGSAKYAGLTVLQGSHRVWSGKIAFDEKALLAPLRWKKPTMIFVNSMSDLFHEGVTDEMRDRIFAVMALCPQHTFQVLTKRPEQMRAYLGAHVVESRVICAVDRLGKAMGWDEWFVPEWPLPNVWLGTSVELSKHLDRVDALRKTPSTVRFLSLEPLLGDLGVIDLSGIDWVICGGESGPGARPMHPAWARSLRDQCVAAGVPFFFKQWGEWSPTGPIQAAQLSVCRMDGWSGQCTHAALEAHYGEAHGGEIASPPWQAMYRVGKKAAGDLLDGVQWHQMPEARRERA